MKLSISYRNVDYHAPLEKDVARHVEKLNKFLKSYAPDLVQFHVVFAMNARKKELSCTLHLSMPTGQKCAGLLHQSLRRVGNASEEASSAAQKRLRMEAQTAARTRRVSLVSAAVWHDVKTIFLDLATQTSVAHKFFAGRRYPRRCTGHDGEPKPS